jgi:lipid II:glycine glycyltransferase (peptidoglycan interpeptide bridge formation enzyme)
MVSAGLFSFNGTNWDYQGSASKRELFDKPLFHSLMWSAILHAKILGCKWFEFGDLSFLHHPSDQLPTKKELGISNFKSGFGGNIKLFLDVRI